MDPFYQGSPMGSQKAVPNYGGHGMQLDVQMRHMDMGHPFPDYRSRVYHMYGGPPPSISCTGQRMIQHHERGSVNVQDPVQQFGRCDPKDNVQHGPTVSQSVGFPPNCSMPFGCEPGCIMLNPHQTDTTCLISLISYESQFNWSGTYGPQQNVMNGVQQQHDNCPAFVECLLDYDSRYPPPLVHHTIDRLQLMRSNGLQVRSSDTSGSTDAEKSPPRSDRQACWSSMEMNRQHIWSSSRHHSQMGGHASDVNNNSGENAPISNEEMELQHIEEEVAKMLEDLRPIPYTDYICHLCGSRRHWIRFCPNRKEGSGNHQSTSYQGRRLSVAMFHCHKCSRKWRSTASLANECQSCRGCQEQVLPVKMFPLPRKDTELDAIDVIHWWNQGLTRDM